MGQKLSARHNTDVLALDRVSKAFGSFVAVKDVSFSVKKGEVFGFLGPNGAGKSTTIRLILDILRPTSGTLTIFGASSRDVRAAHTRLGYLSGDMAMDSNITGRQYLDFVAAQYGKDCSQLQAELAKMLHADLDVKIGNYSRGNRQKVGLVAALQHGPELLVLDEPTSGFDPLVQELFANRIKEFKTGGGTVFMSSHILSEVQQLCDRVAFIKDGELLATTTIGGLMEQAAKQVGVEAPAAEIKEMRIALKKLDGVRLEPASVRTAVRFAFNGKDKELLKILARFNVHDVTIAEPDLESIFMRYYESGTEAQP